MQLEHILQSERAQKMEKNQSELIYIQIIHISFFPIFLRKATKHGQSM